MRACSTIVIFIFCQTVAFAQFIPFSYSFGGNGSDMGYGIAEADDSGYVCVGQVGSDGYTYGSSDVFIFKTDINGQLLWRKNYGGANTDGARTIINAHGGGFIIVGYTNTFGGGGYDYYILKIDEQGDTLWTKTYGGEDWDFAYAACRTSDGNYLIAGETYSYGNGGADVWVLKIDDNGDTLSTFLWGDAGDQMARGIYESSPGVCVLGGYGNFPPAFDNDDSFILSYDHNTHQLFFETIRNEPGEQQISGIDSSATGGIVTFGSYSNADDIWQMMLQFYTASGTFINIPQLEESGTNKKLFCGINYRNQGFYVAGNRNVLGGTGFEVVLYKLGTDGYFVNGAHISANSFNAGMSILESVDKGIVIGGITEGFGPGQSAALVWKIDSMMVPGLTPVPTVGIEESNEIINQIDVYPNPFSDHVIIRSPENVEITQITIINIEGKVVEWYTQNSAATTQDIYLGHLQKGIYFLAIKLKDGRIKRSKLIKN